MKVIQRGSTGVEVVLWQGILEVPQDGVFGHYIDTITKRWQAEQGLTADGIVGPLTWAAATIVEPEPEPEPDV